MELFSGLYVMGGEKSRAFEIYDALPKHRVQSRRESREAISFMFSQVVLPGGSVVDVELFPALISPPMSDDRAGVKKKRIIFPGPREDIIENVIRKLGIQQTAKMSLHIGRESKAHSIRLKFTLRALRDELAANGHGYKLSEIKESLEVLRGSSFKITAMQDGTLNGFHCNLLNSLEFRYPQDDEEGNGCLVIVELNPLATREIIEGRHRTLDYSTLMRLGSHLERWLFRQMSIRFKNAEKQAWADRKKPRFAIKLSTILAHSGISPESRMRNNIARVREALKALVDSGVLARFGGTDKAPAGYEESPVHGSAPKNGGRRPIVDVEWKLIPSDSFAQSIIDANLDQKLRREAAGGQVHLPEPAGRPWQNGDRLL